MLGPCSQRHTCCYRRLLGKSLHWGLWHRAAPFCRFVPLFVGSDGMNRRRPYVSMPLQVCLSHFRICDEGRWETWVHPSYTLSPLTWTCNSLPSITILGLHCLFRSWTRQKEVAIRFRHNSWFFLGQRNANVLKALPPAASVSSVLSPNNLVCSEAQLCPESDDFTFRQRTVVGSIWTW